MGLVWRYGGFSHDAGSVAIQISRERRYNAQFGREMTVHRIGIRGELRAPTFDELTTKIQLLEAAYAVDNQDAGLYKADGVTPTAHTWLSVTALGGIRVIEPPHYLIGDMGDYSTWRKYQLALEAWYEDTTDEIISYAETISQRGFGGQVWKYLGVMEGEWQAQPVNTHHPIYYIQRGLAVGRTAWPEAPDPIWNTEPPWHSELGGIEETRPTIMPNGIMRNWPISWEYHFESMDQLSF